jgi:hypothetical protein
MFGYYKIGVGVKVNGRGKVVHGEGMLHLAEGMVQSPHGRAVCLSWLFSIVYGSTV